MANTNGTNGTPAVKYITATFTAHMTDGSTVDMGTLAMGHKKFQTQSSGFWAQAGNVRIVGASDKDYTLQCQLVENGSNPNGKTAQKRAAAAAKLNAAAAAGQ